MKRFVNHHHHHHYYQHRHHVILHISSSSQATTTSSFITQEKRQLYSSDYRTKNNNNNNNNNNDPTNNLSTVDTNKRRNSHHHQQQPQQHTKHMYQSTVYGYRHLLNKQRAMEQQKQQQQQQLYQQSPTRSSSSMMYTDDHNSNHNDQPWTKSVVHTGLANIFSTPSSSSLPPPTESSQDSQVSPSPPPQLSQTTTAATATTTTSHYRPSAQQQQQQKSSYMRSKPDLNRKFTTHAQHEKHTRRMDQVLSSFLHNHMKPLLLTATTRSASSTASHVNTSTSTTTATTNSATTATTAAAHSKDVTTIINHQSINDNDTAIDSLVDHLIQSQKQHQQYLHDSMSILRFIAQCVNRLKNHSVDQSSLVYESDEDIAMFLSLSHYNNNNEQLDEQQHYYYDHHKKRQDGQLSITKSAIIAQQLNEHLRAQLILVCIRLHERYVMNSTCFTQSFYLIRLLVQLGMDYVASDGGIAHLLVSESNHSTTDTPHTAVVNNVTRAQNNRMIMNDFIIQWMSQLIVSKGITHPVLVENAVIALLQQLIQQDRYGDACALIQSNSSTLNIKNDNVNSIYILLIQSTDSNNRKHVERLMELLTHLYNQIVSYATDDMNRVVLETYTRSKHRYLSVLNMGLKHLSITLQSPSSAISLFKQWYQVPTHKYYESVLDNEKSYLLSSEGQVLSDRNIYLTVLTALRHSQKSEENLQFVMDRLNKEPSLIWNLELCLQSIRCLLSYKDHQEEAYQIFIRSMDQFSHQLLQYSSKEQFIFTAIQLLKQLFVQNPKRMAASDIDELERVLAKLGPFIDARILGLSAVPITADSETWFLLELLRCVDEHVARSAFRPQILDSLVAHSIIQSSDDVQITQKLINRLRELYPDFQLSTNIANTVVSSSRVLNHSDSALLVKLFKQLKDSFNLTPDRNGYESMVLQFVASGKVTEAENVVCFLASQSDQGINSQLVKPLMEYYVPRQAKSKKFGDRANYWTKLHNILANMEHEQERLKTYDDPVVELNNETAHLSLALEADFMK